jgi:hypothetical protein
VQPSYSGVGAADQGGAQLLQDGGSSILFSSSESSANFLPFFAGGDGGTPGFSSINPFFRLASPHIFAFAFPLRSFTLSTFALHPSYLHLRLSTYKPFHRLSLTLLPSLRLSHFAKARPLPPSRRRSVHRTSRRLVFFPPTTVPPPPRLISTVTNAFSLPLSNPSFSFPEFFSLRCKPYLLSPFSPFSSSRTISVFSLPPFVFAFFFHTLRICNFSPRSSAHGFHRRKRRAGEKTAGFRLPHNSLARSADRAIFETTLPLMQRRGRTESVRFVVDTARQTEKETERRRQKRRNRKSWLRREVRLRCVRTGGV